MKRRSFFRKFGLGAIGVSLSQTVDSYSMPDRPNVDAGCPEYPDDFVAPAVSEEQCDPWIELDMNRLAWNIEETRKRVSNRPILAVVKCNAYGHGLVEVSREMARCGISRFAVVKVWEAVSLRNRNIGEMVLNLGPFSRAEAATIVLNDISQSVYSDAVDILADEAKRQKKQAKVHIKIDTGLGRVGIPAREASNFIEKVAARPEIIIEGIMTIMTGKDRIPSQLRDFESICTAAKNKGISLGLRHSAASKDVAENPETYMDMVRPGNCLLGLRPHANMNLKSVLSLKTRVILIKKILAGFDIGWQSQYQIDKDTLFALIPIGYYDGFSPNVSGKAEVLIRGRRYLVSAFISADHTFVDITGSREISIGDEVVIIGRQGNEEITNEELSRVSERSVYRTPTYLNPHMPRLRVFE